MANNKVQLADGTILIDITDTTAVAEDVISGKYFYNAAGVKTEGTASGGSEPYVIVTGEIDSNGGKVIYIDGAVNTTITPDSAGGDIENLSATVLLDLSDDTITPESLLQGVTAHNSLGQPIVGTLDPSMLPVNLQIMFEQDRDGYIVMSDQEYITSAVGVKF